MVDGTEETRKGQLLVGRLGTSLFERNEVLPNTPESSPSTFVGRTKKGHLTYHFPQQSWSVEKE